MTNEEAYRLFFEEEYKEVDDVDDAIFSALVTETSSIAFIVFDFDGCLRTGYADIWLEEEFFLLKNSILYSAFSKALDEGIETLRPAFNILKALQKTAAEGTPCEVCEEYEAVGEECDICLGRGEIFNPKKEYDMDKVYKINKKYLKLNKDELLSAYGQLVLLYIQEEEREATIKKVKLRNMFK